MPELLASILWWSLIVVVALSVTLAMLDSHSANLQRKMKRKR